MQEVGRRLEESLSEMRFNELLTAEVTAGIS
jgi:hypothetical protein